MNYYTVNAFGKTEKLEKFLETYKIPKLTQEKNRNLNRHITCKKIEYQKPSSKGKSRT